ncbi:MAG: PAS domain-containing protein, partial [Methylothermaceae bacterium]|nr:PAS domain-containing protein [Methylothermaceae bacterium]
MEKETQQHSIEAFRHQILESIGEGVVGIDSDGRFTFLNPSACRLLGFAHEEEALGRDAHTVVYLAQSDGTPLPESEYPFWKVM